MINTYFSVAGSGSTVVMTGRVRAHAGVDSLAFLRGQRPDVIRREADT